LNGDWKNIRHSQYPIAAAIAVEPLMSVAKKSRLKNLALSFIADFLC